MVKFTSKQGLLLALAAFAVGLAPGTAGALVVTDQVNIDNRVLRVDTGSQIYDDFDMHVATDDRLFLDAPHFVRAQKNLEVNDTFLIHRQGAPGFGTGSKLYDDWDLHLASDDRIFVDAPEYVRVQNDLEFNGDLNILRKGQMGMATGSSIYDSLDLHIATDDRLFLDAPSYVKTSSDLKVGGGLTVEGTSTLKGNVTVTGHLLPSADSTYDLGSSSMQWRDLYLSGNTINIDSGAATISYDATATVLEIKGEALSVGDAAAGDVTGAAVGDAYVASGLVVGNATTPTILTRYEDDSLYVAGRSEFTGNSWHYGAETFNGPVTTNEAVTLGDGGDTVTINSSDWDIDATGAITGVAFDANGSGNSLTNVENADLVNDTLDFDKFADAMALDAATSVTGTAGEVLSVNRTLTDATDETGIVATFTAADTTSSSTAQYGLYLDNAESSEGLDSLLVLDNSDADDAVAAAITILDAGGGFTNIFNIAGTLISSAELTVWDGGIDLDELNDSGTLTAGSVDINGGSIDGTAIGAASASTGVFTTVDTGQGANELYDMDQNVQTTDAVVFATLDTGQGANELYDMDQNVLTTSDVSFNSVGTTAGLTVGTDLTVTSGARIGTGSTPDLFAALADDSLFVEGQLEVDGASRFDGDASFKTRVNLGIQDVDVADDTVGAQNATVTVTPTASLIRVTCADADGCDATMGEGSATDGDLVVLVHDGATATNYADTDGVSNLTAALAAGDDDVLVLIYDADEWVEVSRADN